MAYQTITVAFEGSLATVCLNRPEKRNALSLACMRELIEVFENIGRTREIRAVILAAAGKATIKTVVTDPVTNASSVSTAYATLQT